MSLFAAVVNLLSKPFLYGVDLQINPFGKRLFRDTLFSEDI